MDQCIGFKVVKDTLLSYMGDRPLGYDSEYTYSLESYYTEGELLGLTEYALNQYDDHATPEDVKGTYNAITQYVGEKGNELDPVYMELLERFLWCAPKFLRDVPLYRGISIQEDSLYKEFLNLDIGDLVPSVGVTSTSIYRRTAMRFSTGFKYSVLLVISKYYSGVNIEAYSKYPEGEVLFSSNACFKVIDKHVNRNVMIIEVEEV